MTIAKILVITVLSGLSSLSAFAQVGALPYHYKITARTGTGGSNDDFLLSFEIHDANHVVKGTEIFRYSLGLRPQDIREGIATLVKARAATDAGSTALLITTMIGVDNDMDAAPAPAASVPDASTTVKGISILAVDNEATLSKPMKSDDPRGSNDRTANNLRSATTVIGISAAAAPIAGKVLTASSPTAADWQTPAAGAVSSVFTRTGAVVAASGDYTAAQVTGAEATANKAAANGYAGLGANSRVPTAQLGSGTADATTFLRGDQTYAAPSGGSDPWTYVRLASDFTTSSATAVDVTGLAFTPAANLLYEISGIFLLRTATTTVGPRTGVAWPTGMTDGVVVLKVESAAGTQVMAQGNPNAAVLVPVGGLPTNTQSYPGELNGMLLAGATPSGTFKIQLASETALTNVTMKAGSFIRYRTIP